MQGSHYQQRPAMKTASSRLGARHRNASPLMATLRFGPSEWPPRSCIRERVSQLDIRYQLVRAALLCVVRSLMYG